jgi:thiamine biosynthesis lipoprotein
MIRRYAIIGLMICLFGVLLWRARPVETRSIHGQAMGCEWTLKWRGTAATPAELQHEANKVLSHWEQVMSTWRADSDLSRFNQGAPATSDLRWVIDLAESMRQQSEGAFDPHVLEKVHQAGFAPVGKGLDLSGIGKGFAVDRVGERLRALGVNDFLFQLAGETLAGDGVWEVGIEAPDPSSRTLTKKVTLQKQALATSGNYRQFQRTDQGIVSHIIDPRSGKPVIRPFSSVTVIASDCAQADAWSTALFVLGKDHSPASLKVIWQE